MKAIREPRGTMEVKSMSIVGPEVGAAAKAASAAKAATKAAKATKPKIEKKIVLKTKKVLVDAKPVNQVDAIIRTELKAVSDKYQEPSVLRTIFRSCIQNRSLRDIAYQMGFTKTKLSFWLRMAQVHPEFVPEEVVYAFLSVAHGYNRITMNVVESMLGYKPMTVKQLRKAKRLAKKAGEIAPTGEILWGYFNGTITEPAKKLHIV